MYLFLLIASGCMVWFTYQRPDVNAIFYQRGAPVGDIEVYPTIKITDLSGAYVTCIYCSLSVKINTREMSHETSTRMCVKIVSDFFLLACGCGKN